MPKSPTPAVQVFNPTKFQTLLELFAKLYKEYNECKDPEQKAKIWEELNNIHRARLQQYHRESFASPFSK